MACSSRRASGQTLARAHDITAERVVSCLHTYTDPCADTPPACPKGVSRTPVLAPEPASLSFLPLALRAGVARACAREGPGVGREVQRQGKHAWCLMQREREREGHARNFGVSERARRCSRAHAPRQPHTPPAASPVGAPTVPERTQSAGIISLQPPASVMRATGPKTPRVGVRRAAGVSGVVSDEYS